MKMFNHFSKSLFWPCSHWWKPCRRVELHFALKIGVARDFQTHVHTHARPTGSPKMLEYGTVVNVLVFQVIRNSCRKFLFWNHWLWKTLSLSVRESGQTTFNSPFAFTLPYTRLSFHVLNNRKNTLYSNEWKTWSPGATSLRLSYKSS